MEIDEFVTRANQLTQQLKGARARVEQLAAERRDVSRQLVAKVGVTAAAELLGVRRQTLAEVLSPREIRGRRTRNARDARPPRDPPLLPLLRAGLLRPDDVLQLRRRGLSAVVATVTANGELSIDGQTMPTPSRAARFVLGSQSADGWVRWRTPDGKTLAELRAELQTIPGPEA